MEGNSHLDIELQVFGSDIEDDCAKRRSTGSSSIRNSGGSSSGEQSGESRSSGKNREEVEAEGEGSVEKKGMSEGEDFVVGSDVGLVCETRRITVGEGYGRKGMSMRWYGILGS